MRPLLNIIVGVLFAGLFLIPATFVRAQNNSSTFGVADYIKIADKSVEDGSIVSSTSNGFSLSKVPYDHQMVGVAVLRPAIVFNPDKIPAGSYPLVTNGQVLVLVSGLNGPIKIGDVITTSNQTGIGMKATKTGYVLGYALSNFNPKSKTDVTKIPINLKIFLYTTQPSVASNLWDILNISTVAAAEEPILVFKYFIAAFVLILSIAFGFASFGRMASRGVEALGRNPLAAKIIEVGMILNIIITIVIIIAGLVVALFIVRL